MKRASIGFFTYMLVSAVALPIFAAVALLVYQLNFNEQAALERRTARLAQSMATDVQRNLQEMATSLRLVASDPNLGRGDFRQFHARTEAALQSGPLYVIVVRHDGRQLLNTRVPYGSDLGRTADPATLATVLESGRMAVSGVFWGTVGGKWVFDVLMPLPPGLPDGAAAIIITKDADDLSRLVATDTLPIGWSAAVVDGAGHVVVSSDPGSHPQGALFSNPDFGGIDLSSAGVQLTPTGSELMVGVANVPGWAWRAIVWAPRAGAQESLLVNWRTLIVGGLVLLLVAIVSAFLFARHLRNSIEGLAAMAEKLAEGHVVSPVRTHIREVDTVAGALSTASFVRVESESQVRMISRELAHRTKNLLTVAQVLVRQTGMRVNSVPQFQETIIDRINGLARSIDMLIAQDWSPVPLKSLIKGHLTAFGVSDTQLEIHGDPLLLKPSATQNLGMVLHELATNACKYGALSDPHGKVTVTWRIDEVAGAPSSVTIEWIESDGPRPSRPGQEGLGSTIIRRHAAQAFDGEVDLDYARTGLRWRLVAPLRAFVVGSEEASGLEPAPAAGVRAKAPRDTAVS